MSVLKLEQSSISMEEGRVVRWLVGDGTHVRMGDLVVEVETDKATMEVEAPASGTLRIVAAEGAIVPVDGVLAEIGDDARPDAREGADDDSPPKHGAAGAPAAALSSALSRDESPASPAARRLARERGVALDSLTGSGPGGRIVAADVERASSARVVAEPSPLRAAVLGNIVASWREIPHIHVVGELQADGLVEARKLARSSNVRITVTDLLVFAVARGLQEVPELNGVFHEGGAHVDPSRVSIGLAVATARGVVAPVLRDAGERSLAEIARERDRLVSAAREGTADKRDFSGATVTLSNLGTYPVDFFAPVISGPQIALVATGRIAERAVVVDGLLGVRPRIVVNVAVDHRAADGEAAGRFLRSLETRITELPAALGGREATKETSR